MSYRIVALPLYSDPYYDYTVDLEGQSIKLRFTVNVRQGIYHFDVIADDDTPIIEGVALIPYEAMCEKYNMTAFGLTGYFYLEPINPEISFAGISTDALRDYYQLFYVFEETE